MAQQTDGTRKSIFADFSSLVNQIPLNTNPVMVTLESTDGIFGIGHSDTVNPEEITILTPGTYTITAQAQVGKASGGVKRDQDFFFQIDRQDGNGFVDIPDSNAITTIKDSEITLIAMLSLVKILLAQWKVRVMQRVSSTTGGLGLIAFPAVVGPPTVPHTPSIIVTIFKNAEAGAPL